MSEPLDLLGDPVMQRDATFLRTGVRLTLSRRWGPGPRACVIGCNPSDADALKDDQTSKWWNRWFQHYGFGGYDAVNVFPFCSPDPRVMAYTFCANDFNSTPFSSCCETASFGKSCARCGEEITFHQDSPAVARAKALRRQGRCGMCGKPKGDPAISGNCHC